MLARIAAQFQASSNRHYRPLGIKVLGSRVLLALLEKNGRRAGELAYATGIQRSTMSYLLRRLSKRGWIKLQRDPSDNRSVNVTLTSSGRELGQAGYALGELYETVAFRGLSPKDVAQFKQTLDRILQNVDQLEREIATHQLRLDRLVSSRRKPRKGGAR